ncbi:STAS domain protein [Pseudomonas sp. R4-39-08]|uniref:STAS domain-containing protein n=1 Tax=Pseudomonas sp. R4-39-08 TaxID=1173288 RepID=UPI000F58CD47|nr:STAS domain-containing protein [Pseudomonas sp. R4-39-08]AZF36915.1 STAS domain protein [Pseudomonas sp. R4-39-08]
MPITCETLDDTARVGIDGELTIYTVAELASVLLPQMGVAPRLELDLSQVTEMDGAGLQLLAVIQREAGIAGTALSVTGQSQAVTQALELCRNAAL